MDIPVKTLERLSKYRRLLLKHAELSSNYIFSHDLAALLRINPVHVRRDLMLIGFTGNFRNGYLVVDLIRRIEEVLPPPHTIAATIIGMDDLGRAVLNLIQMNPDSPFRIPVTFDVNPANTNKLFFGIPCYDLTKAPACIQQDKIMIAMLTSIGHDLQEITDTMLTLGIEGFINCSSTTIKVPPNIHLREFDLYSTIDEMAYFL